MTPLAQRAPRSLLPLAAARLTGPVDHASAADGVRFIRNARDAGIDPELIWCVMSSDGMVVAACLAAPSPGGAATVFLSPVSQSNAESERAALAACLDAISAELPLLSPVQLLQALPEQHEQHAIRAFETSGFERIADLLYLRRALPLDDASRNRRHGAPNGLRLRSLDELGGLDASRERITSLLGETYAETLDCPRLCAIRDPHDILLSHLSVGTFDPGMWWFIIDASDEWRGCVLLSPTPSDQTAELVYLGISPALRGSGASRWALATAIEGIPKQHGIETIACAVDAQNTPARRIYDEFGFVTIGSRVAMVRAIHRSSMRLEQP